MGDIHFLSFANVPPEGIVPASALGCDADVQRVFAFSTRAAQAWRKGKAMSREHHNLYSFPALSEDGNVPPPQKENRIALSKAARVARCCR